MSPQSTTRSHTKPLVRAGSRTPAVKSHQHSDQKTGVLNPVFKVSSRFHEPEVPYPWEAKILINRNQIFWILPQLTVRLETRMSFSTSIVQVRTSA